MKFFNNAVKNLKKFLYKENLIELICTVLSSWLLSVGTALILDSQFTVMIGVKAIIWQTLATTVLILLLTRRRWITPICLGVLIPVFLLVLYFSGNFIPFFKGAYGFFKWWFGGMSLDSKWYTDKSYYLIHTFMNIGVSILYFAVARITKKAWISVIIALTFFTANFAFGYTRYSILTIPFLIVAIFPLITSEKFQKIKLPDFADVFGIRGKKWLMIAVSTLIAFLVALTSLFVVTKTKDGVRTRICTDVITDLQTVTNTYTKEQENLNMTLYDLGLANNKDYIGGDFENIVSRVVATTDLRWPTRVKMTSFDSFNGKNWINNFEKSYRINSVFWKSQQESYLSTQLKDNETFMESIEGVAFKSKVTFNMRAKTHFLPTVGQILGFEESKKTKNSITFDRHGRLISYYGQPDKYSYTIESLVYNTRSSRSESKINAVLNNFAYIEDPLYDKSGEFYKHYTKSFYEKPPKAVESALKKLISDQYNEYQKAYKISEYFSKNGYIYVKKPYNFKEGDDIVQKLFETKRGHSVYYATAMVAMAREAGIPSRLVAGYVTVPSPNKRMQVIDISSPYAWVECYIPNIGWMTFDPSPKNELSITITGTTLDDEEDDFFDSSEEETEEEKEVGGTDLKWSTALTEKIPYIIAASLLIIVLLISIIHTITSQNSYKLKNVRKRFSSTKKQAKYYYFDILRQFKWLGFKANSAETIKETTQKVSDGLMPDYAQTFDVAIESIKSLFYNGTLPDKFQINEINTAKKLIKNALKGKGNNLAILQPEEYNTLNKAMDTLCALYYGGVVPGDSQVEEIAKARESLEVILKQKNNIFMYTIKRRLLLPTFTHKMLKRK